MFFLFNQLVCIVQAYMCSLPKPFQSSSTCASELGDKDSNQGVEHCLEADPILQEAQGSGWLFF
jgi:hypothetical protein